MWGTLAEFPAFLSAILYGQSIYKTKKYKF